VESAVERGAIDEVVRALQACPDGAAGLADGLNLTALHLYIAGRRAAAGALWTRAVRLAPRQANILFNLARLKAEMGQSDDARLLLKRVLTLRPHLTPGRLLFARLQAELQQGAR